MDGERNVRSKRGLDALEAQQPQVVVDNVPVRAERPNQGADPPLSTLSDYCEVTFLTHKPRIAGFRSDQTKVLAAAQGYLFRRDRPSGDLHVTHVGTGRRIVMPWSSVDYAKEWDNDASW